MKKFKIKKSFPGSPKENSVLSLFKPIVGFPYYRDAACNYKLSVETVENDPEYFEEIRADYWAFSRDFNKINTISFITVKKLNNNGQLCYYDRIKVDFGEKELKTVKNLLEKAGFKVDTITHTYTGIYDPTRIAELIELYPTDEELLKKELLYKK